jgi:hypothetical protein
VLQEGATGIEEEEAIIPELTSSGLGFLIVA